MTEIKPKVLLVDDDPAMLLLIAKWLGSNYDIRTAADGRQGIAKIQADCPDVLITDWEMPGMNGLQLVRWLREQTLPQYVYTLLLTVRCGKADIIQGFEAGVDDFLKKPVDKDELVARMLSGKRVIASEYKLRALTRTDALTGLLNRSTFLAQMEMEWGRATRLPIPMSCVMIDFDRFQRVNAERGRVMGDEVFRLLAQLIQKNTRVSDGVCRFTNEQIAVLLAETNEANALLWAERIRQEVEHAQFPLSDGTSLSLTASFGVSQRRRDTESYTELMEAAQQALAVAKEEGRNRVILDSSLATARQAPLSTVSETFAHLAAHEVMSPVVPRLWQSDCLEQALKFFIRFNLTEAAVVDNSRRLVGMVSQRDLMSATLQNGWQEEPILNLVQGKATCFTEQTPVLEIYGHFCRTNAQSVVIVKEGRPFGIIYRPALMSHLTDVCPASLDEANVPFVMFPAPQAV